MIPTTATYSQSKRMPLPGSVNPSFGARFTWKEVLKFKLRDISLKAEMKGPGSPGIVSSTVGCGIKGAAYIAGPAGFLPLASAMYGIGQGLKWFGIAYFFTFRRTAKQDVTTPAKEALDPNATPTDLKQPESFPSSLSEERSVVVNGAEGQTIVDTNTKPLSKVY
ncbi:MAG: hypothetical protein K2X66_07410 [Cyanobacteria bacterium]|nr:hypothetical protein [Cyanobacteriota bacterium]